MVTTDQDEPKRPKAVFWIGSSRKDLRAFPKLVRQTVGQALYEAQTGGKHADAKPLKGFGGAGVLEILEDEDGGTYRIVYTVKFAEIVYVLHAFQKKSKTGSKTPKPDKKLIESRLIDAREDYEKWIKENAEEG